MADKPQVKTINAKAPNHPKRMARAIERIDTIAIELHSQLADVRRRRNATICAAAQMPPDGRLQISQQIENQEAKIRQVDQMLRESRLRLDRLFFHCTIVFRPGVMTSLDQRRCRVLFDRELAKCKKLAVEYKRILKL